MTKKIIVISALIALAVSFVFGLVFKPSQSNGVVGGLSDRDIKALTLDVKGVSSVGTFMQGGDVRATSTSGTTVPLLATDFDIENTIDVTLNVQDATLSFPATSTLKSFIPNVGDTRTLFIRNATTTAAMDLTISGGTGVLMKKATTTAILYGDTDGANFAVVDLIRKANTDIEAIVVFYGD